jgi:hypothetical protein
MFFLLRLERRLLLVLLLQLRLRLVQFRIHLSKLVSVH